MFLLIKPTEFEEFFSTEIVTAEIVYWHTWLEISFGESHLLWLLLYAYL